MYLVNVSFFKMMKMNECKEKNLVDSQIEWVVCMDAFKHEMSLGLVLFCAFECRIHNCCRRSPSLSAIAHKHSAHFIYVLDSIIYDLCIGLQNTFEQLCNNSSSCQQFIKVFFGFTKSPSPPPQKKGLIRISKWDENLHTNI